MIYDDIKLVFQNSKTDLLSYASSECGHPDRQTDRQTTAQHVRTYRYVLLELCLLLMSIYLTEAINFLLSIAISLI
jgi:hypothetical protein